MTGFIHIIIISSNIIIIIISNINVIIILHIVRSLSDVMIPVQVITPGVI